MATLRCRHRCAALIILLCICLTIIGAVVWKTMSSPSNKSDTSALDSDFHHDLSDDSLIPSKTDPDPDCHQMPSGEDADDTDHPIKDQSDLQSNSVPIEDRDDSKPAPSPTADLQRQSEDDSAYVDHLLDCERDILINENIFGIQELTQNKFIDSTIPSCAVDKNGRPFDWVLKGPDMFDQVLRYNRTTGNTASRRYLWYIHMNRVNETTSLYDQLGIEQSCTETWVSTAITTAQEIRRQIMRYFVFYTVPELSVDLSSWNEVKDLAPEKVQHRIQVFIAKFESLEWFDEIRRVTQNDLDDPPFFRSLEHYFNYIRLFMSWTEKYAHLGSEVKELSFQGCTRVFIIADKPSIAEQKAFMSIQFVLMHMEDIERTPQNERFSVDLMKACQIGYELLRCLSSPLRAILKLLRSYVKEAHPEEPLPDLPEEPTREPPVQSGSFRKCSGQLPGNDLDDLTPTQ